MKTNEIRARITGTDSYITGQPYSVYGNGIDSIKNENGIEYIDIDTIEPIKESEGTK